MQFCPKCGKKSFGICADCFLEEHPIKLKEFQLKVCRCGRFFYLDKWRTDIESHIERIVERKLTIPTGITIKKVKTKSKISDKKISLEVDLLGNYKNELILYKLHEDIKIIKTMCPDCSRLASSYYEAVLQLRPEISIDINQEFVSDKKKVQGGIDIYLTSLEYARQLAGNLRKKGFYVKESAEHIGMKDGKKLYRTFISVKSPNFSEGDFLKFDDKIFRVIKLGQTVLCRDVISKKEKTIPLSRVSDSEVIARSNEIKKMIVTNVTPNEIQLLEPHTHVTHDISGKFRDIKAGNEIATIKIDGKIYILA